MADAEIVPFIVNDDMSFLEKGTNGSVLRAIGGSSYRKSIRHILINRGDCLQVESPVGQVNVDGSSIVWSYSYLEGHCGIQLM